MCLSAKALPAARPRGAFAPRRRRCPPLEPGAFDSRSPPGIMPRKGAGVDDAMLARRLEGEAGVVIEGADGRAKAPGSSPRLRPARLCGAFSSLALYQGAPGSRVQPLIWAFLWPLEAFCPLSACLQQHPPLPQALMRSSCAAIEEPRGLSASALPEALPARSCTSSSHGSRPRSRFTSAAQPVELSCLRSDHSQKPPAMLIWITHALLIHNSCACLARSASYSQLLSLQALGLQSPRAGPP